MHVRGSSVSSPPWRCYGWVLSSVNRGVHAGVGERGICTSRKGLADGSGLSPRCRIAFLHVCSKRRIVNLADLGAGFGGVPQCSRVLWRRGWSENESIVKVKSDGHRGDHDAREVEALPLDVVHPWRETLKESSRVFRSWASGAHAPLFSQLAGGPV